MVYLLLRILLLAKSGLFSLSFFSLSLNLEVIYTEFFWAGGRIGLLIYYISFGSVNRFYYCYLFKVWLKRVPRCAGLSHLEGTKLSSAKENF